MQPELSCIRCLAVSLYGYVSRHSLPNFKLTKTSALKPLRSSVCDCRRNGMPRNANEQVEYALASRSLLRRAGKMKARTW